MQVSTLANLASSYLNCNLEAERWGTEHVSIVPYQSFETKDGYMTIGKKNTQKCFLAFSFNVAPLPVAIPHRVAHH